MIDFDAIEFFFAKQKKHHITFPLEEKKQMQKKASIPPTKKVYPQMRPAANAPAAPPPQKLSATPSYKKPSPPKEEKKDHFYTEWQKKYKALQAENLLAKKPFRKLALFVIEKSAPKEFAEKIFSAINTRLMKAEFVVSSAPIEELIEKYNPTHIITTNKVTCHLPLPGILIDNLRDIERCPEKKKKLWGEIKTSLKE